MTPRGGAARLAATTLDREEIRPRGVHHRSQCRVLHEQDLVKARLAKYCTLFRLSTKQILP